MSVKNDPIAHLDDRRVVDAFLGSGALGYPWWVNLLSRETPMTWDLGIDDPEQPRTRVTRITPDVLRAALRDLLGSEDTCYTVAAVDWTDPEVDGDVDADIADCVLQFACLGSVVYG